MCVCTFRYRQDPCFHYITGFLEPRAFCVLIKETRKFYMFVKEYNKQETTWEGFRAGTIATKEV